VIEAVHGEHFAILKRRANKLRLWVEPLSFDTYRLCPFNQRDKAIIEEGSYYKVRKAIDEFQIESSPEHDAP
jgi:hypothetical protein